MKWATSHRQQPATQAPPALFPWTSSLQPTCCGPIPGTPSTEVRPLPHAAVLSREQGAAALELLVGRLGDLFILPGHHESQTLFPCGVKCNKCRGEYTNINVLFYSSVNHYRVNLHIHPLGQEVELQFRSPHASFYYKHESFSRFLLS